jgi:hypothetical protein
MPFQDAVMPAMVKKFFKLFGQHALQFRGESRLLKPENLTLEPDLYSSSLPLVSLEVVL